MKKAFIIMAHQCPEQINIFIRQLLMDADSDIYIHISAKYDYIRDELIKSDRVFVTKKNIVINWGSDELTKAFLIMFKEITLSNKDYEYVLICTGQDLMVKNGLNDFLEEHKNEIFLECKNEPGRERHLKTRLLHNWPAFYTRKYDFKYHPARILRSIRYRLINIGLPIGKKKLRFDTHGLKLYYNYIWGALPYDVIKYVSDYFEQNPDFFDLYKNSMFPAECLLATIIMQSKYKEQIHFVGYESKSLTFLKTMNKNMHPPILRVSDIPEIEKSNYFFARKFDIGVDREVVDYFAQKIINSKGDK